MKFIILLLTCVTFITCAEWAVLVAGSNSWENYRHQADICHAYQILHENGYPDSNIIVMMYDDIAFNKDNPYKGVIINDINKNNVYVNVPKDYIGDDVNPSVFLNVLMGNATGKSLNTGPDDNIFIYFADHGGPGLICFANYQALYSHELIQTFQWMYDNKRYNQIVFYMESCYSGSMFNGLLDPSLNIYAVTASTPDSKSFACCFDEHVMNYLGDEWSVFFLENSDNFENLLYDSFNDQYNYLANVTTSSTPCQYGNMNVAKEFLSNFLVDNNLQQCKVRNNSRNNSINMNRSYIRSTDVKLDLMYRQYYKTGDVQLYHDIISELAERYIYQLIFGNELIEMNNMLNEKASGDSCHPSYYIDTVCLKEKIDQFKSMFGPLNDNNMKYIKVIGRSCFVY